MKKFIAMLLALCIVFGLCACGAKTEPEKNQVPTVAEKEETQPLKDESPTLAPERDTVPLN